MSEPLPSLLDELRRVSADLDELIGAMSDGRPSPQRHDTHVDRVEGLAARMRRAARGAGRPVHPPLARLGGGFIW